MTIEAPLNLWREVTKPDWIDYNGHLNVAYYTLIFDHAVDTFRSSVGLDDAYRDATGGSTFTVEQHITWDREVMEGDEVRVESRLLGYDEKRFHHYHEMYHVADGYLASTTEFLSLHIDLTVRRVTPMPADILDRLAALWESHRDLPRPENAGRVIVTPNPETR